MIFVHIPKTGGSFVKENIQEIDCKYFQNHTPLNDIPVSDEKVVSIIRNPVDWWGSVFRFLIKINAIGYNTQHTLPLGIDKFIYHAMNSPKLLDEITYLFCKVKAGNEIIERDIGLLTWLVEYMTTIDGKNAVDIFLRTETLTEDFEKTFNSSINIGKVNVTWNGRKPNDKTVELIRHKEHIIFERFEYN